jgi:hypothetical protein
MDMLLRNVTMPELAAIYRKNRRRSPAPYLLDAKAIGRARRLAKKNGQWDDLAKHLDPTQDIASIKRSAYRNYERIGDRGVPQAAAGRRRTELNRAFLALWLGHPNANVDYLQDLLWAYCDQWTWVMAAHEARQIDLGSAALTSTLAEILHAVGDRLEAEVTERVTAEIDRRTFQVFSEYQHLDGWETVRMNWNHVCNGEIIRAALYQVEDPQHLARLTHAAIQNLTYALDGFASDGGCEEGPGYWGYGFGHYLYVAQALYLKTNGAIDLFQGDRIDAICRYPLAAHIKDNLRSTFADSSHGYIPLRAALIINEHKQLPELFDLCEPNKDGSLSASGHHELATLTTQKVSGKPDPKDYFLPGLGQVKLRSKPGPRSLTLMAIAGHNGVPHNHNDIGSFIIHRGDKLWLNDPGGPVYNRKTFGPNRYDIVFCNSLGHSVPVVNGKLQQPGSRYRGTITVKGLNESGLKSATIEMARAYPKGTVDRLIRTFSLDRDANKITLADDYAFARKPRSLEEAFITFEKVTVARGGRSVQIGPKGKGVTLSAVESGRFSLSALTEGSKEGRSGQTIQRITFVPRTLERKMTLTFEIE